VKIQDILPKNAVLPDLKATDKRELITQMAHFLTSLYNLKDPAVITERILNRESSVSTGIGFGIAIPHARVDGIERVYLIIGRCIEGVEFNAIDESPVHILFMMISPSNTSAEHTALLLAISKIMSKTEVRDKMMAAENAEQLLAVLIEGENKNAD
jgi:PTS system nitrogen regulatory IIA component